MCAAGMSGLSQEFTSYEQVLPNPHDAGGSRQKIRSEQVKMKHQSERRCPGNLNLSFEQFPISPSKARENQS